MPELQRAGIPALGLNSADGAKALQSCNMIPDGLLGKGTPSQSWNSGTRALADTILCDLVADVALDILDREGLPHLAHLICGWGNVSVAGRNLFERIFDFSATFGQTSFIPQNDPNGDFHPWQSFAYSTMADPRALEFARGGVDLKMLACNSIDLNTDNETDLGHFLYAVGCMRREERPTGAIFSQKSFAMERIVHCAIEGHFYGGFEVCRKFHLTEGLCSISRALGGTVDKDIVDEFLRGQLDSLKPLSVIVSLVSDHVDLEIGQMPTVAADLLRDLRNLLVLGDAVENLYYYAGHLIELAAVGLQSGYETPRAYEALIIEIVSNLDALLNIIHRDLAFAESFYAFAHYRRGIAMFGDAMQWQSGTAGVSHLATNGSNSAKYNSRTKLQRPFAFAPQKTMPRERFRAVLEAFNSDADPCHQARGEFPHFRKIMPAGLPLGVHFELLDYGRFVGAEIHCERELYKDHGIFEELARNIEQRTSRSTIFEPGWYKGCGRVIVPCDDSLPPEHVAHVMLQIIEIALPQLAERYRTTEIAAN